MDAYVARQPIFDQKKNVFAYELLFRNSMDNYMPKIDGDTATIKVLSSSFFTLGFDKMIGETKAFVNFTRNLIVDKTPQFFPNEQTVVEILEDVEPDDEILECCQELKAKGYIIALDDFISRPEMKPLVDLADIIKIDFMEVSIDNMEAYIEPLVGTGVRLLAEKVETHEEFERAIELGFELFQGYFFCKPEIIKGREIPSSQLTILEIMAEANREEILFDKIKVIIERDVAISYKLLRYINSAFYKRINEITTIKQALVILGEAEIRRFVSMIALAQLVADKPGELTLTSFIRAKFLELLAKKSSVTGPQPDPPELFTLGLFSLIDAILDQTMAHIMEKLPLSEAIDDALIRGEGSLAIFLEIVRCYEKGLWAELSKALTETGISEDSLPPLYLEACDWSNSLINT